MIRFRSADGRRAGIALLLALAAPAVWADIDVPSDGSDGVFAPTQNVVVDLSRALPGDWRQTGNGNGVYDPVQWAVVFKYASVNIPAGVTVTFRNHPNNPPVVWLVQGDVTIAGTVSLDGQGGQPSPLLSMPGPGGFAGGSGPASGIQQSSGHGPGGGRQLTGTGGSFGGFDAGRPAATRGPVYGNPALLPLIGGSGGSTISGIGSGAGGGAILIAARRTVTVTGMIRAIGGDAVNWDPNVGGGSGGGVRIVAETLAGAGQVRTDGGPRAGFGRIRFDVVSLTGTFTTVPTPSVAYLGGEPPVIWPDPGQPRIRVSTVAGLPVPEDPAARMFAGLTDLELPELGTVPVVIEATNVPLDWTVEVRLVPRHGPDLVVAATRTAGDAIASTWQADVAFPRGVTAVYVRAASPAGSPPARPGR